MIIFLENAIHQCCVVVLARQPKGALLGFLILASSSRHPIFIRFISNIEQRVIE
jgi:hypothetical protein